jgi:hypothetical protein
MTPAEERFVADYRKHVGTRLLKEDAGMAAYRLVCGGEAATFDTFRAELVDLQHKAERLGAAQLPEPARTELLDEVLPRTLLYWISDWSQKWAEARLTAEAVNADVGAWNERLIAWAKGVGVLPEDWSPPDEWATTEPPKAEWPDDLG